jgi:hypothetical protein
MEIEAVYEPHPDAERERALGLDALAEALADLYMARARAEVARTRGLTEEAIDREDGGLAEEIHQLRSLPAAFDSECEDRVTQAGIKDNDTVSCRRPRRKAGRKG